MHVFGAGINETEERGGHAVNSMLEKINSLKDQPFSPKELIESAILIQLWQWLTSQKVSLDEPVLKLLLEFAKQRLERSFIYQKIPFHSYLPMEHNRNIKRAKDIQHLIFSPVFQNHLKTYTPGVIRDMTDSFISAYKKEMAKETSKDIGSIDDIPDLMLSVTLLVWWFRYNLYFNGLVYIVHGSVS